MFCMLPVSPSFAQLLHSVKHLVTVSSSLLLRKSLFPLGFRVILHTRAAEFPKALRNVGFTVRFIHSLFPFSKNCIRQPKYCALTDLDA